MEYVEHMRSIEVDGVKLRKAREQAGWSVERLADAAECSIWHIYRIEAGRGQPSAEVYGRIKAGLEKALPAEEVDLLTTEEGAA